MSEEEKEQWLYEEYKYISNFDFNRLDKYEEANDDLCIDDLILDYTMLYEHYKKEIERPNKKIAQYENPEDMTLMFMWCEEKAKDEIKRLNNIIKEFEILIKNEINESKLEEDYERVDVLEYCLATLQELKN